MNRNEPSTTPARMPSLRSRNTVRQKSHEEDQRLAAGAPEGRQEFVPLGHRGGDDDEDSGERRKGMYEASGAPKTMKARMKIECSMPETGPMAPERTFVAVRAIVPVAQSPPKAALAALAIPCATSSQFERWRRPVMASATTAERSDDAAEERQRQRVRQHRDDALDAHLRQRRNRQRVGDAAEAGADGLDFSPKRWAATEASATEMERRARTDAGVSGAGSSRC